TGLVFVALLFVLLSNKPQVGIYLVIFSVYFIRFGIVNFGIPVYFRWLSTLVILMMSGAALLNLAMEKKEIDVNRLPKWILASFILLVTLALLSMLINKTSLISAVVGFRRPFEMLLLFLFFVTDSRLNNPTFSRKLLGILWVIVLLQIPLILFEFFFYDLWVSIKPNLPYTSGLIDSAKGFMGHSGSLALSTIFVLFWIIHKNMISSKYSYCLLGLTYLVIFFITYSMASWYYLFAVILFYLYYYGRQIGIRRIVGLVIFIFILFTVITYGDKYVSHMMLERKNQVSGYIESHFFSHYYGQLYSKVGRFYSIGLVFYELKSRGDLIFGIGPGTLSESHFGGYSSRTAANLIALTGQNTVFLNQISPSVGEFGVPFFVVYLLMIIFCFYKTLSMSKIEQDKVFRPFLQALLALDIIMITGIFYNAIWYIPQISFIFWIGSAIAFQKIGAVAKKREQVASGISKYETQTNEDTLCFRRST
ncbi:MAG: hypothetical protein K8S18_14135, partial [Desulfobacula sp.]|nr:hypothetical protein [Desulfobacula sp.]